MTPADVLAAARALLVWEDGTAAGVWPRAGAYLARQALEESLSGFWRRSTSMSGVGDCPMATQLVCLRTAAAPNLAPDVASTWAALSRACHYHPYELAPTAAELTGWFGSVDRIIAALEER